jgi:uncharacterized membrane protein
MKKYLIAGLLIWLPLAVTLWVIDFVLSFTDRALLLLPVDWQPERLFGRHIPGLGLISSLLVIFVTGVLAANIIGARLVRWWEGLLHRIPFVRSIYSSVKQVSDTLFAQKGDSFRKVVLVEFPQRGQWTIAFIVGAPGERVTRLLDGDVVTVYVPTAPNPTSGYVIMVKSNEVRELDISVDEAFKFHVSLGVVTPPEPARATRPAALMRETPGSGHAD